MAMQGIAAEGEAVLLPSPWYFNHRMALTMQGVRAIPVPTRAEDGFVPDPARIAALVADPIATPRTPSRSRPAKAAAKARAVEAEVKATASAPSAASESGTSGTVR